MIGMDLVTLGCYQRCMADVIYEKKARITFAATGPQLLALEREAAELDISQQELIRRILDNWRFTLPDRTDAPAPKD